MENEDIAFATAVMPKGFKPQWPSIYAKVSWKGQCNSSKQMTQMLHVGNNGNIYLHFPFNVAMFHLI